MDLLRSHKFLQFRKQRTLHTVLLCKSKGMLFRNGYPPLRTELSLDAASLMVRKDVKEMCGREQRNYIKDTCATCTAEDKGSWASRPKSCRQCCAYIPPDKGRKYKFILWWLESQIWTRPRFKFCWTAKLISYLHTLSLICILGLLWYKMLFWAFWMKSKTHI